MNFYSDHEKPYFPRYLGLNLSDEEEDATDDKIRKFIGSNRSEETSRKTGLRRIARHCEKQNGVGTFEQLSSAELNTLLCSFLIDAKKDNGDNYETTTIHCMFSIIGRFFKDHGLGDLEKDTEYQGGRDVNKAKLKMLKRPS